MRWNSRNKPINNKNVGHWICQRLYKFSHSKSNGEKRSFADKVRRRRMRLRVSCAGVKEANLCKRSSNQEKKTFLNKARKLPGLGQHLDKVSDFKNLSSVLERRLTFHEQLWRQWHGHTKRQVWSLTVHFRKSSSSSYVGIERWNFRNMRWGIFEIVKAEMKHTGESKTKNDM